MSLTPKPKKLSGEVASIVIKSFGTLLSDKDYLTLELHDEPYRRIVITIPENIAWAERIDRALNELRTDR